MLHGNLLKESCSTLCYIGYPGQKDLLLICSKKNARITDFSCFICMIIICSENFFHLIKVSWKKIEIAPAMQAKSASTIHKGKEIFYHYYNGQSPLETLVTDLTFQYLPIRRIMNVAQFDIWKVHSRLTNYSSALKHKYLPI